MILREPGAQNELIGTTGSLMSLLPVVREMTPSVDENHFHKFLRKADFYLISRNPRLSPLDCLLGLGDLEFPLDLAKMVKKKLRGRLPFSLSILL